VEITKSGKVHFLEPKQMADRGVSLQGFTTRHEGVSRPPYNSLNLGLSTNDSPHNVEGNRSILARALGTRVEQLVTVTQVHGSDLLLLDQPNPDFAHFQRLECDGIVTNQPEVMIGVCTADCVPVLLLDPVHRVIAALHAGWKGSAEGIVRKGVEAMTSLFDGNPADILAAIGPAIGPCCYEVDQPVANAFRAAGNDFDACAEPLGEGSWRLNLAEVNRRQLLRAGLDERNIETTPLCVCCEKDLFFSYRRDKGETGRQMGFIMLKTGK